MRERIVRKSFAAMVAVGAWTGSAQADTTGPMGMTATVVTTCTIGTPPLINLGTHTSTQGGGHSDTNIPITCSKGGGYKVFIDNGQNPLGNTRRVSNGPYTLSYALYADAAETKPFPTNAADAATQTGTGLSVGTFVRYRILAQPTPPVGTYTDTLLITVQY